MGTYDVVVEGRNVFIKKTALPSFCRNTYDRKVIGMFATRKKAEQVAKSYAFSNNLIFNN